MKHWPYPHSAAAPLVWLQVVLAAVGQPESASRAVATNAMSGFDLIDMKKFDPERTGGSGARDEPR